MASSRAHQVVAILKFIRLISPAIQDSNYRALNEASNSNSADEGLRRAEHWCL